MATLSGTESVPDKSTVQAVYSPEQWPEGMDSDDELGEYPAGGIKYFERRSRSGLQISALLRKGNGYEEEENLSIHFFVYAVYDRHSCICSRKVDKGTAGI